MKKLISALVALSAIAVIGVGIMRNQKIPSQQGKLRVVASFYPLYFFAKEIGGDRITVTNITPAGAEPHDYEPTTRDIAGIEQSDILVLNGQLEAWGDKIKENLKGKKTIIVVAGDGLVTGNDPHVWLDPVLAKKEAGTIANAFQKKDPINALYYQSNMVKFGEKLDALHLEFQKGLATCRQKNIVTSHAAFGYIATRYNLKQVPIAGLSPDEEPSPQKLAEIAQFTKANNIKYIFFESLVSPRLAETVARETGATTIAFNPLEGLTHEQETQGADYFLLQRQNLDNLTVALACP